MKKVKAARILLLGAGLTAMLPLTATAGVVKIGNASYSDEFPGKDEAGRNGYPVGNPYLSGKAAGRPAPTNDWWSAEIANPHATAIFNYPLTLCPKDQGLVMIDNLRFQGATADVPVTIGVQGLSASESTVCDYSDWTVTIRWADDASSMEAIVGLGMPMVYFTKTGDAPVVIDVRMGTVTIEGSTAYITNSYNGGSYAVYGPEGCHWTQQGSLLTSDLAGKDYWTVAMLPKDGDHKKVAQAFHSYAFAFPADTRAEWAYDRNTGKVITTYKFTADVKEGAENRVLAGLLPHHYVNLSGETPEYLGIEYPTVRGTLRLAPITEFTTELTFHGLLPSLPAHPELTTETSFSTEEMKRLVGAVCEDNGFADWTDSYNDGQLLNRMLQTAEAAKASGDEEGFRAAFDLVKKQLERWLVYTPGDIAFMFYYHEPWNTMLGYPAGHGQDTNMNDHNFHWGYFIRAAAFVARYDRSWLDGWQGMIDLLVRDVASADRQDPMFPYLRSFSPYAGHCWANGTASLSLGNDQESTSEAMQFNTALMLWADVTGNSELRDLAVYLYVTELSAIEQYWFDVDDTNLEPGFTSALASRVFGNAYDNENFWGGGMAGSYGIQIYPVHAGSFYLYNRPEYHARLWEAMCQETQILADDSNPNIWYDTWLRYLAMSDPIKALDLYSRCSHLGEKFGESQAHTYHWIHTMSLLGTPRMDITADHPLAMAFELDGRITYVAANQDTTDLEVTYSDGHKVTVKAGETICESDGVLRPTATLSVSGTPEEGVATVITADVKDRGLGIEKVEFFCDGISLGADSEAPYAADWIPAAAGEHLLTANIVTATGDIFPAREYAVRVKKAGTPDVVGCTFIGRESSEGSFTDDYIITCVTNGSNVDIHASFKGEYVGFAGPWLFDETNGFREIVMNADGDNRYKTTLSGLKEGDIIRFRVKIAYAGGLGVTKQIEYEVGSYDPTSAVEGIGVTEEAAVWPNPATEAWNIKVGSQEGEYSVWNLLGIRMAAGSLTEGRARIEAAAWPAGRYILRLSTPAGCKVVNLLKK